MEHDTLSEGGDSVLSGANAHVATKVVMKPHGTGACETTPLKSNEKEVSAD